MFSYMNQRKNPTKPTLKLLTFPHMYLTFWPKHGTNLPNVRQFLGTSTSFTLAMPACRRQCSIAKNIPHNIWVQNPSFTMEDFNGPMEEEVPCADYHVQAPAVSFGVVYLKFKFSDLQSRHPIKSWKHLKYWNKTWEFKIRYISRKMKNNHLKQSGSFQTKSVNQWFQRLAQNQRSQPIPKVTLKRVPNSHQRWRGSPPKKGVVRE